MSPNSKYENLERLLASSNWQLADEETRKLTFQVDLVKLRNGKDIAARKEISSLIDQFPLEDLRLIDQLWINYSDGRFGFEVQWNIFQKLRAEYKQNPEEVIARYPIQGRWSLNAALAVEIGWLSRGAFEWVFDLNTFYSLDAPIGHLPTLGKQEMGCAFHHGFMLNWIFPKLHPYKNDNAQKPKNDYGEVFIKSYMDNCVEASGGKVEYCKCTINKIQDKYTLDEFVKMTQGLPLGKELPPEFMEIMQSCAKPKGVI